MDLFTKLFSFSSANQVEPQQVQSRMAQHPRPFLLDVRQPEEYRAGHIRGAELIPLNELPKKMARIPKGREIICVCRSGNRSKAAVNQLASAGFQAANLKGGMIGWERAGLPVKKGV